MTPEKLLAQIAERPDWHDDAICNQMDPTIWFPKQKKFTADAKVICLRCPVKDQCLAEALVNNERFGVWGGLNEPERRALREKRITTPEERTEILTRLAAGQSANAVAEGMHISWYRVKAVQMESEAAA